MSEVSYRDMGVLFSLLVVVMCSSCQKGPARDSLNGREPLVDTSASSLKESSLGSEPRERDPENTCKHSIKHPGHKSDELFKAIDKGDADELWELLQKGADIESEAGENGSTPLIRAVYRGKPDLVRLLLKCGAKVNASDDYGYTALAVASAMGSEKAIERLLAVGAALDVKTRAGLTPIELAIKCLKPKAMKALLRIEGGPVPSEEELNKPLDLARDLKNAIMESVAAQESEPDFRRRLNSQAERELCSRTPWGHQSTDTLAEMIGLLENRIGP